MEKSKPRGQIVRGIIVGLASWLGLSILWMLGWGFVMFLAFFLLPAKFARIGTLMSLVVWTTLEMLIVLNASHRARRIGDGMSLAFWIVFTLGMLAVLTFVLWTWVINPLRIQSYWWEF